MVDASFQDPVSLIGNSTNYPTNQTGDRTLQVDTIVYDKRNQSLNAYEIKRGNVLHDAGKRRSILRDLLCVEVLLKSYGESKGYNVKASRSHIIFYYGKCSVKKPFSIINTELDEHFNFPIFEEVEKVNDYFRQRLFNLLTVPD